MFLHYLVLLVIIGIFQTVSGVRDMVHGRCETATSKIYNGEAIPYSFILRVWVSRYDSVDQSCMGVIFRNDFNQHTPMYAYVPKWCLRWKGEIRGRVAFYIPRPRDTKVFSPARQSSTHDEQFDLLYQTDDVKSMVRSTNLGKFLAVPNSYHLELPAMVRKPVHLTAICLWDEGSWLLNNVARLMAFSWKQNFNGHSFFVQEVHDLMNLTSSSSPLKSSDTLDDVELVFRESPEVLVSVSKDGEFVLEGFFKRPLNSATGD